MLPAALSLAVALSPPARRARRLSNLSPQVEIQVDEAATPHLSVSLTTWVDLAALRDAIAADEITTTLDGVPLVIDPVATGTFGAGDRYVAAFALPAALSKQAVAPSSSTIAISDGAITWAAQIDRLFRANDAAPTGPLVAGTNVFEWPSAASPAAWSTIAWACVEVVGSSAACDGESAQDPAIAISQQYITASVSGSPGDAIELTGERRVNPRQLRRWPDVLHAHPRALHGRLAALTPGLVNRFGLARDPLEALAARSVTSAPICCRSLVSRARSSRVSSSGARGPRREPRRGASPARSPPSRSLPRPRPPRPSPEPR